MLSFAIAFFDSKIKRLIVQFPHIQSISNSILSFLFFIPSMVLLLYGGMLVIQGKLTIGSIVALSSYLNQLFQPIQSLANINIDLQKSLAAFRRYREIADINTEIDDISRIEKRKVNEIKIKNITVNVNRNLSHMLMNF